MSDWSTYELIDIVWDDFGDSCDCVVPHQDVEHHDDSKAQCDTHKKARHTLVVATKTNSDSNVSVQRNVSPQIEEPSGCSSSTVGNYKEVNGPADASQKALLSASYSTCTDKLGTSVSEKCRNDNNLFTGQGIAENGAKFCFDCHDLKYSSVADKGGLRPVSVSVSSDGNDTDFGVIETKNELNSDILDYEWPDIGSLEDVDRFFSNDYSQFGQASSGTANELSWFSSSYTFDGSEEPLKSGFQSSYSDLSGFSELVEHNETSVINWPGNGEAALRNYKSTHHAFGSHGHWLNADVHGEEMFASKGMKEIPKCTHPQLKGNDKGRTSEYHQIPTSIVQSTKRNPPTTCHSASSGQPDNVLENESPSTVQLYASQMEMSNTKSVLEVKCQNSDGKAKKDYKIFLAKNKNSIAPSQEHQKIHEISGPALTFPTNGQKSEEIGELHGRLTASNVVECTAIPMLLSEQSSFEEKQLKLEKMVKGNSEHEEANRDPLLFGKKCISEQQSTGTICSKNSLSGPTSLRQLQSIMDQLDLRTKLCMRDGLYRLARNAQHRHNVDDTISDCKAVTGCVKINESRCPVLADVETGTNPLDRSIAHLLFYRAPK